MSKQRWTLFVVAAGEQMDGTDRRADNLGEAETIAKELYAKYDDGNYCDLQVWCVPHSEWNNDYAEHHPEDDFPVWSKDCFGECYWRVMRMGEYMPIGIVYDADFIKNIKDYEEAHKPKHIDSLTTEQFEELTKSIGWGSMYLSDYRNDFDVPEEEVCGYAEGYSDGLYREYGDDWSEHVNAADFAEYCYA